MASGNNNDRIRQAAERSTPPLSPEARNRVLRAVTAAMRRRSPLRIAILVVLVLLVLAAAAYLLLRSVFPR